LKFWKTAEHKVSFEHARLITAHYSKSFYISAKMLPRQKRWATYALYGFCRYADNLIDNPRQRSKADLIHEVEYLEHEIRCAYESGESEHPIIQPFIFIAKKYDIPMEYPLDLLKGVKMDLTIKRYETFDDLYVFCYRVAGVVGLMMTYVLGYKSKEAFEYAEKLGIAMQLTNILRDVQEDKNMGRIYLPQEDLSRFGLSECDIMDERMHGKMRALMKFQIKRAHSYYAEADKGIHLLDRDAQFAIFSSSKIYHGILHKIEARNYNPFLGRVYVPQIKKFAILLKEVIRTRVVSPFLITAPYKVEYNLAEKA
jgi:15-cis-phytoene synthase